MHRTRLITESTRRITMNLWLLVQSRSVGLPVHCMKPSTKRAIELARPKLMILASCTYLSMSKIKVERRILNSSPIISNASSLLLTYFTILYFLSFRKWWTTMFWITRIETKYEPIIIKTGYLAKNEVLIEISNAAAS